MKLSSPLLGVSLVILLTSFPIIVDLARLRESASLTLHNRLHVVLLKEDVHRILQESAGALAALNQSYLSDSGIPEEVIDRALQTGLDRLASGLNSPRGLMCKWELSEYALENATAYYVKLHISTMAMQGDVIVQATHRFLVVFQRPQEAAESGVHNSP